MEKIKNLLNPGAKQDNEVLYGDGNPGQTSTSTGTTGTSGTTGTLTGEGSHFGNSRTDPSTTSDYNNSSTTAGPHSSNVANKADPRVDSDLDGSRGLGGQSTTGTTGQQYGNQGPIGSNTNAGPHSSGLANKADPRVDSDLDGSRGLGGQSTTGTTGQQYGTQGTQGPYSSSTNAGPHSSGLANKADPRVDSDLDGSRGFGSQNAGVGPGTHERFGEDQTGGIGSGTTGPRSSMPGAFSDGGYPSTASTTSVKSGIPGRGAADPTVGSDTNKPLPHRPAHGAGEVAATGTAAGIGAESAHHHHNQQHQLGSSTNAGQLGSGLDTTSGANTTAPAHSHHAGHHARQEDALNEGSGLGTGSGTYPDATSSHQAGHHKDHHVGRDAAVGAGALGAFEKHEHGGHGHKYAGDPCGDGTDAPTGVPDHVSGPHSTLTANRLDPEVGSGHGAREHLASTGAGAGVAGGAYDTDQRDPSTATGQTSHGHHAGRADPAVIGGSYEAGQTDPSTSTGPASKTIGQHKSNVMNVLDPRVQPDPEKMKGRHAGVNDPAASGTSEYDNPYSKSGVDSRVDSTPRSGAATTGNDHHYGRDAGLAGAGVAGLEGERHRHDKNAGLDGSGTTSNTTGKDHHYGRDAGLAGAGVAGLEGEHHHHDRNAGLASAGTTSGTTSGHGYGRDAGLAAGTAGAGHEYSKHNEHPGESKHDLKRAEKQESKHEKAVEKEEKKEEKAAIKEEKKEEKEEKKEEKAAIKEEKKEEKAAEKADKGGKKHGGILGLFHRDKPDESLKEEEAARKEREGIATGVGSGAAAHDGHNKLHKDPPTGYTKGEGLDNTTNTTGTSGQVIEPHTGLPINPDKYGTSGAGGIDNGSAPGYHEHGGHHDSTGLNKTSSPNQTTGGAYSGGY
ncbi:MAG: hypothetical protein M1819_005910 [Sarea resinae]|nr:MAG: hypothetical protein M1819_005910 [Sarea resinae]